MKPHEVLGEREVLVLVHGRAIATVHSRRGSEDNGTGGARIVKGGGVEDVAEGGVAGVRAWSMVYEVRVNVVPQAGKRGADGGRGAGEGGRGSTNIPVDTADL